MTGKVRAIRPTRPRFREDLDPDAYRRAAAASAGARDGSPLSIYVHIPFCQSPCFYCGFRPAAAGAAPQMSRVI